MLHLALALALDAASPSAAPAPSPPAVLYVRGQILSVGRSYVVFTTGDAVRLRAGTPVPAGTTLGSRVRVAIDEGTHDITAIERDPRLPRENEIEVADLPRDDVAVSPKSAGSPAPPQLGMLRSSGAAARGAVTLTLEVTVPANTPPSDDVYVATARSNYSPSEIRMQRTSARRFTVSIALPAETTLKYQYTRGTYATIERDRSGGIAAPRELDALPHAATDDTVVRWADLN